MSAGYHAAVGPTSTFPEGGGGPLAGWRVLVTRPEEQAGALADALAAEGAVAIVYPTIALAPPPSWDAFDAAVADLTAYDWIVFTSPSAVRFAVGRRAELARDLAARAGAGPAAPGAPAPQRPRVAAVGAETARALGAVGIDVALVPEDQRQEGLVAALASVPAGARILFPQALGGRELLPEALSSRGVQVQVVPVSQTRPLPLAIAPPPFDVAIFASPSALKAFLAGAAAGPAALSGKVVAVIGPTTEAAARASGIAVDVIPPVPSVSALVAALVAHRRSDLTKSEG